jgi:Na+-driven multidrug efflux pump
MGVAGAGLASSLSMLFAVFMLWRYFIQMESFVSIKAQYFAFDTSCWKRLFKIGFPAGGEFFLMFAYMALVYWSIQGFGANATAGFGLGSRVVQALFLPAMALAFALPAVAGQNFGAKLPQRVKDSFKWAVIFSTILMGGLIPISLWTAAPIASTFSEDSAVLAVATGFLGIICFNFIPSGVIFCCSGASRYWQYLAKPYQHGHQTGNLRHSFNLAYPTRRLLYRTSLAAIGGYCSVANAVIAILCEKRILKTFEIQLIQHS